MVVVFLLLVLLAFVVVSVAAVETSAVASCAAVAHALEVAGFAAFPAFRGLGGAFVALVGHRVPTVFALGAARDVVRLLAILNLSGRLRSLAA